MAIILGIESSCDDTSAAIMKDGILLSNIMATQEIHKKYGGIVPEVASRAHQENILPVIQEAIEVAGINKNDISAIAFTRGPGLLGSLIVGVSFAKSLALALDVPIIEVNHMKAHVLAHFIEDPKPSFPFLCLTVSGGHTQLIKVEDHDTYITLGETIDDAAGEAFDKSGKLLGLAYPAGPEIDKLASQGKPIFDFPEPKVPDLNFSFSGLKTSILYFLQRELAKNDNFINENLNDLCASIQDRIITILVNKLAKAQAQTGITEIAIAGGVSANSGLRHAVTEFAKSIGGKCYVPRISYCTDNAGMIAMAGYLKYQKGEFAEHDVAPSARIKM